MDKAAKYHGGGEFAKKNQNRFDKMKKKGELKFELKRNPVLVSLEKITKLTHKIQVLQAFERIKYEFA